MNHHDNFQGRQIGHVCSALILIGGHASNASEQGFFFFLRSAQSVGASDTKGGKLASVFVGNARCCFLKMNQVLFFQSFQFHRVVTTVVVLGRVFGMRSERSLRNSSTNGGVRAQEKVDAGRFSGGSSKSQEPIHLLNGKYKGE